MRVCEAQSLGALMTLLISLVVYGGESFLNGRYPLPKASLPWGDQEPGMMVMEVTGSKGADGIYFLSERTTIDEIPKIIGVDGKVEPASQSFSPGIGYIIFVEGGVLKISDMPAIRRLALGLPIDLNRASVEELSQVPGIGERLAVQIVELRNMQRKFESVSDLTTVRGIKEKKLNALKKYLTVRPVPP